MDKWTFSLQVLQITFEYKMTLYIKISNILVHTNK